MVAMLDSLMDSITALSVFVKTAADTSKGLYKKAAESHTSCSFNRAAPVIFAMKAGSDIHGGTVDCLFGAVKEHSLWTCNGGSQGMKSDLNRELAVIFQHVNEGVVMQLGHRDAANVAQEYLKRKRSVFKML
jgi:hypothetical protein